MSQKNFILLTLMFFSIIFSQTVIGMIEDLIVATNETSLEDLNKVENNKPAIEIPIETTPTPTTSLTSCDRDAYDKMIETYHKKTRRIIKELTTIALKQGELIDKIKENHKKPTALDTAAEVSTIFICIAILSYSSYYLYSWLYPVKWLIRDEAIEVMEQEQIEKELEQARIDAQRNFMECLETHKESVKNSRGIPCNCENQEQNFIIQIGFKAFNEFIKKQ